MKWFARPHPFIFTPASVLLPGLITFLIILLFAPVGYQNMSLVHRAGFGLGFGIVASLSVMLIVKMLQIIHPNYKEEWSVGREVLLILTVLCSICLFIFVILFSFDLTDLTASDLFMQVIVTTLTISFFPVVILVLFEQYNHQRSQWKKALEMSSMLPQAVTHPGNDLIQLFGENGKLELQVSPHELIYLKSDGNYVDVIYGPEQTEKKLVRNRLKVLAEVLPDALFFQCHKSYIVNRSHIISVKGNARNFELKLRNVPDFIPVSRGKSEELTQFLKA